MRKYIHNTSTEFWKNKDWVELAAHGHYHSCERTDIGECEFFELDTADMSDNVDNILVPTVYFTKKTHIYLILDGDYLQISLIIKLLKKIYQIMVMELRYLS